MALQTLTFRAARNEKSLARLEKSLPKIFPPEVLQHARRKALIPPTPRLCVESYWRHHPVRADRLARALARRSGAPEGWEWRLGGDREDGLPTSFRAPPAPFREKKYALGPGHCCVCGQKVYKLGWHIDLWGVGAEGNKNAAWHSCCVTAWNLWTAPSDHVRHLKRLQKNKCIATGVRLLKDAEVDHRKPLFKVWRERGDHAWPDLLGFWGAPNLQVINRAAHLDKSVRETGERARSRILSESSAESAVSDGDALQASSGLLSINGS